jgi:hypothetical protein
MLRLLAPSCRPIAAKGVHCKRPTPWAIIGLSTTLAFSHQYATSTPIYSESKSSTLFREASPAALRKPSSQLVFLSRFKERRKDWESWIGYFREAGYDCFDMNIATKDETKSELGVMAAELTSQLRLLSIQRPPLVFAFHDKGSDEAIEQIQSSKPAMSGLVIVVPSSDKETIEKLSGLNKEKLRIFIVDESQEKDAALQQVERWMSAQGLA